MSATVRTSMDYTWFIKGTVRHDGTTLDAFGGEGFYQMALSNSEEILFNFNASSSNNYLVPESLHHVFNHAFRVIDPCNVSETVANIRKIFEGSNFLFHGIESFQIAALRDCGKSVAGIGLLMKASGVAKGKKFEEIEKAAIAHFSNFKSNINNKKGVIKFLDPHYMVSGENVSAFFSFFEGLPTSYAKTEFNREFIHLLYSAFADKKNDDKILADVQPCEINATEKCDGYLLATVQLFPVTYKSVNEYLLTQKVCDIKLLIGRIYGDSSEEVTLALSKSVIGAQLETLAKEEKTPALAHETYSAAVSILPSANNVIRLSKINTTLILHYSETWKLSVIKEWLDAQPVETDDMVDYGEKICNYVDTLFRLEEIQDWIEFKNEEDENAIGVLIELMANKISLIEVMDVIQRVHDEAAPLTFQQWLNFIDDPSVCESTPVSWWGNLL